MKAHTHLDVSLRINGKEYRPVKIGLDHSLHRPCYWYKYFIQSPTGKTLTIFTWWVTVDNYWEYFITENVCESYADISKFSIDMDRNVMGIDAIDEEKEVDPVIEEWINDWDNMVTDFLGTRQHAFLLKNMHFITPGKF